MSPSSLRWCLLFGVALAPLAACKKKEPPPAPVLTAVAPIRGYLSGGTDVQLTGQYLTGVQGVMFGDSPANNVREGDGSSVRVVTGSAMRGVVAVSITTPGGTASLPTAFTYISPISLTAFEPLSITNGQSTQVAIRGSGLYPPVTVLVTGPNSFSQTLTAGMGTTDAAVPVDIPSLAPGSYTLQVTNGDGEAATFPTQLTVLGAAAPTVTGASPSRGLERGGSQVRIAGTQFLGATAVRFGSTNAPGFTVNTNGTEVVVPAPAGTRGRVALSVTTPAGTGTLENGYTYTRAVVVTGLTPPQLPSNVASTLTITGTGMVPPVRVSLSGPQTVDLQVSMASETSVQVNVPALPAGNYAVTVSNLDGESATAPSPLRLRLGLTVQGIYPPAGFTDETTTVEIEGAGLQGVTHVVLGTDPCTNLVVLTSQRVRCTTPVHAAGAVDVFVREGTTSEGVLVGGFTYVDASQASVKLLSVEPGGGRTTGAESVEILMTGRGTSTPTVFFGTNAGAVGAANGRRVPVTTPAYTISGTALSQRVPVTVNTGSGQDTVQGVFRYHVRPALNVVNPTKGATVGGDVVQVAGSGFSEEGTAVLFDGVPCKDVVWMSRTLVQCQIPPHAAGIVPVQVRNEFDASVLVQGAFEYVEAVRIVATDPAVVSMAGNTLVEAIGSGFASGRMRLTVVEDNVQATDVEVLSATVLRFRTPPHPAGGTVTLRVEDTARLGQPFSSGDSRLVYDDLTVPEGGVRGGAIQRNVSVSVLHKETGARIPSAVVFLGDSYLNATLHGLTNGAGQLVLSQSTLQGPVTLTAAADGFAAFTMVDMDSAEITVRLEPQAATLPTAPTMATISGSITGWQYAGYPNGFAAGQIKRVAAVFVSEPKAGQAAWPPGSFNVISETPCDVTADAFNNPLPQVFSVQAPVGTQVALLAVVFFYDSKDGNCTPNSPEAEGFMPLTSVAMGVLPNVVVQGGTNPGNDIAINVSSALDLEANLTGAPQSPGGQTVYSVDAILELGNSGVLTFTSGLSTSGTVGFLRSAPTGAAGYLPPGFGTLASIPTGIPVTGGVPPYTFRGVAGTASGTAPGGYSYPYSEAFKRNVVNNREVISGFYSIPSSYNPPQGGTLLARTFTWGSLGRTDGVVSVEIARVVAELPTGTVVAPAWTVLMPGNATSVTLPMLLGAPVGDELTAADAYYWQVQATKVFAEDVFTWQDHTSDKLSEQGHWEAHLVGMPVMFGL